ncbi:CaiB/BaiF CoA transferase family protein [Thermodesulfobacteriota bacterium]
MVIETASVLAGPMAGRLLADWGADVIHVEHITRGDIVRSRVAGGGGQIDSEIDYIAENYNRNKRGMTLDLAQEDGREIMYKMLSKADVYLSNFRLHELEKFKLKYDMLSQINPRLICASLTGYGKKGSDRDLPGYESTAYFARSGMLHVLQVPESRPTVNPSGLGDNIAGLSLAYGIMAALFMREKTGEGQEVDVSLFNTGIFAISLDIAGALATGQDRQPLKREDYGNALTNLYRTKDNRWLRLSMNQPDPYWSRFCHVIERKDLENDPRFKSFIPRIQNHIELFNIVEKVFLTKTLEDWKNRLNKAGLPWAPLQNLPEVIADPQARANDFFDSYDHPVYGPLEIVENPIKLSKSPKREKISAPQFNQHTEEILLEFGYTWSDIEKFKNNKIIA